MAKKFWSLAWPFGYYQRLLVFGDDDGERPALVFRFVDGQLRPSFLDALNYRILDEIKRPANDYTNGYLGRAELVYF